MSQVIRRTREVEWMKRRILLAGARAFQNVWDVERPPHIPEVAAAFLLVVRFGEKVVAEEEVSLEEQLRYLMEDRLNIELSHARGAQGYCNDRNVTHLNRQRALAWLALNVQMIIEHLNVHGPDSLSGDLRKKIQVLLRFDKDRVVV